MFDMLTTSELDDLHRQLCRAHTRYFNRIMNPDWTPRMDPQSADWALIRAAMTETLETIEAVSAELGRRSAEWFATHA